MTRTTFSWEISDYFKSTLTADRLTSFILQPAGPSEFAILRSGPSRAQAALFRRTWENARKLQAQHIPLRRPAALGCSQNFGMLREACLVLENIPQAVPLSGYITACAARPGGLMPAEGSELADVFLGFTAQLRKYWTLPPDFNMGDVLVCASPEGAPALYLADAGRLAPKRQTSGRSRIDGLLMIDAALWGKAPSRQQIMLAQMARQFGKQWLANAGRRLADLVGELRFVPARSVFEPARRFESGGLKGFVRIGPTEEALVSILERPDDLFSLPDAVVLKNSPTTTAALAQCPGLPFPLHVKRYNPKGRLYGLRYLLRRSRARRIWELAARLQGAPIATPEVLGYAERRKLGFLRAAYLVTRGIPSAEQLDRYIERKYRGLMRERKTLFLQKLAVVLGSAHGAGLIHGDLKATNILVEEAGDDWLLWLVDLDSARARRSPDLRDRSGDIARLNRSIPGSSSISRSDRLRILAWYLGDAAPLRTAWYLIVRITREKLQQAG